MIEIRSQFLFQSRGAAEYLLQCVSILAQIRWKHLACADHFTDGIGHHGSGHGTSAHADSFDIRRSQSQSLKDLILKHNTSRYGAGRDESTFVVKFLKASVEQTLQLDSGNTPFIHHTPGAHSCAAAGAVNCEKVYLSIGSKLDRQCQVSGPVCSGLKSHVFSSQPSQPLYFLAEAILVNHAQP